jgi:hypothetical protein
MCSDREHPPEAAQLQLLDALTQCRFLQASKQKSY